MKMIVRRDRRPSVRKVEFRAGDDDVIALVDVAEGGQARRGNVGLNDLEVRTDAAAAA